MINKFTGFIDFIFNFLLPKDEETTKLENMSCFELLENIPKAQELKNNRYKAVFQYKDKLARKAIWSIKYNKNQKLIEKFSNILYEFIIEEISDETIFSTFKNPLLIPIPMYKKDLYIRGYNQSELIVKEIIKIDEGRNFKYIKNILIKIKETPHQSKLKNKTERLKNLKNCFSTSIENVKDRNIILIDDVITTGTTMSEATKVLKDAGAKKVIGFSIAH